MPGEKKYVNDYPGACPERGQRSLRHKGYNKVMNGQRYKYKTYQGQELNDELNLNWLSFKYRNYDPAIGRFAAVDPLATKYPYNSTYAFSENSPIGFFELEGTEKVSIHTRAFAPFKTFGGGFSGDDRGFSTSTTATSRIKQNVNINFNKATPVVSGGKQTSNASHHPILGTATAKSRNALKNVHTNKTITGSKHVSFESDMKGANPLTLSLVTPNIDVDGIYSISSNQKTNTLYVSADIEGDNFPSTESFITDSAGNSVFIGVGALKGNPYKSLKGEGRKPIINSSLQINYNSKGVFQNVIYQGRQYSIEDNTVLNDFNWL